MTKRKLVLNTHRKMWAPIVAKLIDGLLREPPRTNGQGQRAKIQLKLHKDFKHVVKWPKCVLVPCDDPDYIIREYRNCTLLDHLFSLTISQWNTSMIYKRRSGLLASMTALHKSLDNCLLEEYDDNLPLKGENEWAKLKVEALTNNALHNLKNVQRR